MSTFVNLVSGVILFKVINIAQGRACYFLRKSGNMESGIFAIQACYTIIII